MKKTEQEIMDEFRKIRFLPLMSVIAVILGFLMGIALYRVTRLPLMVFPTTILGVVIYVQLSYRYKCPNCHTYLWFVRNKIALKRCPKCNAQLRK